MSIVDPTSATSPASSSDWPRLYTDPRVFERERAQLFGKEWIFAGLANELALNNDYIRVPHMGRDVIVQNCKGILRAFLNSCSHRHSQIHVQPRGNRPMVCPYHGWAYDDRGVPTGIPCREEFPDVCANPQAFRLHELELARAGQFIFLRESDGGADLRTFLGEAFMFLEQVSAALGETLDETFGTVRANWKIVIENSLEGYHVPLVHRGSLDAIAQLSREMGAVQDFLPRSGHSYMHNKASASWLKRWTPMRQNIGSWPFEFDHYVHQLVFPILTVTSFLGYSFHIQRFHPDAVDSTTVHSRICASTFTNQTERGSRILANLFRENVDFTHRIFEEDRGACERVQAGSLSATRNSVLASKLEQRVADFRHTYDRFQDRSDKLSATTASERAARGAAVEG